MRSRVRGRIKGLGALLMAALLVFCTMPTSALALGDGDSYYFFVNGAGDPEKQNILLCSGQESQDIPGGVYASLTDDNSYNNGYVFQETEGSGSTIYRVKTSPLTLVADSQYVESGDTIAPERDVKVYCGDVSQEGTVGIAQVSVDGVPMPSNTDRGNSGAMSFDLPAGTYALAFDTSKAESGAYAIDLTTVITSIVGSPDKAELVAGGEGIELVVTPTAAKSQVSWTSTNEGVATVDQTGKVTPVAEGEAEIKATLKDNPDVFGVCQVKVSAPKPEGPSVSYAGHAQTHGDLAAVRDGQTLGTTGEGKRLEQFSAELSGIPDATISYRAHMRGIGWGDWVTNGGKCGTIGESRRIEAVQMQLNGAAGYHVWYRVHSQTFGWLGWACDGQAAGTAGQSKRVEAMQVKVLPDGADLSKELEDYSAGQASYVGAVTADVHLQTTGWTGAKHALEFGTTGQSRRLEAIRMTAPGLPAAGGITYEVHVQKKGWIPPVADGALAGTTGKSRRLEAVRISLTPGSDAASSYSVWYRVHSQTYGWLGWAHDGAEAGTTGLSKRAEAIDVQVLPQGQVPKGFDASAAPSING